MTTISLFTPVSYKRPRSSTEEALSTISHYFYLGGNRAKVIRNDEVRLERGKISWGTIALKVASYILLFPLTLTLFAINVCLRYQHNFTIVSPSPKPKNKEPFLGVHPKSKELPHFITTPTVQNTESAKIPAENKDNRMNNDEVNENILREQNSPCTDNENVKRTAAKSAVQQMLVSPNLIGNPSQLLEESPSSSKMPVKPSETIVFHNEEAELLSLEKEAESLSLEKEAESLSLEKEAESLSLEEFKEKLKYFNTSDENLDRIAKDLFEIAPKTLELTDIVNLIFEQCSKYDISLLLDAILSVRPSFSLSPYDKIRRAILEDKEHVLNNISFIALLKEHALETDEEKLTACYNLAYRLNHPYIYRLSQTPILSSDYNLNFLWVNLNPQDRIKDTAQNIFGNGLNSSENAECIKDPKALRHTEENERSLKNEELENWKNIKKSFCYRISRWADFNPGAQINLWYDSALVTQKAQQKTFEMMKSISESRGVNLKLKDIRKLSNIEGEIGHSLHPGTQVYYRVDLIKALIADHMMSSEESPKYCVVSDIDVQPIPPQHMFDQRTVDYLSSNGYVFNRVGLMSNFENSFFIFNKENENLKKIHYETIIKGTAAHIASLRKYPIGTALREGSFLGAQFVFSRYSNFRTRMEEQEDELTDPRKVMKCPKSQFNFGGNFLDSDCQAEEFRFIGKSNIPYTKKGRNCKNYGEGQIEELLEWKAEPLSLVD